MKMPVMLLYFLLAGMALAAQTAPLAENIFIITTDGFRWQELFTGADSALINNPDYVEDTALAKQLYWCGDMAERRKMLMPFFWKVIARKGQLWGNRLLGNQSDAANPYKISYPGYNELFTGSTDPSIMFNAPKENPHTNILEYLNRLKAYQGKVVAFSSWYVFPFILNAERSGFTVNSGYAHLQEEKEDSVLQWIGRVQDQVGSKSNTRYDWLTYLNAKEYILQHHPKVVFIGLGETDECAHAGHYDLYLNHAAAVDQMIGDLWYYVQTSPVYRDKTAFIISTDHGRGSKEENWTNHSLFTTGSAHTWLAMIGPGIAPLGEMKTRQQIYQKQIPVTIARLLGLEFHTVKRTGKPIAAVSIPASRPLAAAR